MRVNRRKTLEVGEHTARALSNYWYRKPHEYMDGYGNHCIHLGTSLNDYPGRRWEEKYRPEFATPFLFPWPITWFTPVCWRIFWEMQKQERRYRGRYSIT